MLYQIDEVTGARFHAGKLNTPPELSRLKASPLSANTPWRSISIAGWQLPLMLDEQGDMLEPNVLQSLFLSKQQRTRGRNVS